jgi:hypothetical protein
MMLDSSAPAFCRRYFRVADKPGVGTEEQNAATLNDFVRAAQIFELPASLIR